MGGKGRLDPRIPGGFSGALLGLCSVPLLTASSPQLQAPSKWLFPSKANSWTGGGGTSQPDWSCPALHKGPSVRWCKRHTRPDPQAPWAQGQRQLHGYSGRGCESFEIQLLFRKPVEQLGPLMLSARAVMETLTRFCASWPNILQMKIPTPLISFKLN